MKGSEYSLRVVDAELDELIAGLPAIAIEGAKSVGKTWTASRRAHTIHDLDDPEQRRIAGAEPARLLDDPAPILIDEWQHVPEIWDLVRRRVDRGAAPGQFLLTGSASPRLPGTHSGAGRIVSIRMRPLSLAERSSEQPTVSLRELFGGTRAQLYGKTEWRLEDYVTEILQSGLPGIRDFSGRTLTAQLDGYLHRIVDKDFAELGHHLRNPVALRHWMEAYAAASSTTASFEKIRRAASAGQADPPSQPATVPYRDVLERLWILDPVPAWAPTRSHINRLSFPPKHQLADPALAARLLDVHAEDLLTGKSPGPPTPRDGTLLGALFESLVTLSLRVYAQAAEARVFHLRTGGGRHEIDLLATRGDRVVAFEVKLGRFPDGADLRHLKWLAREIGDDLPRRPS